MLFNMNVTIQVLQSLLGQFHPWNFAKFWKQSLDFVVKRFGICMSVTQEKWLI